MKSLSVSPKKEAGSIEMKTKLARVLYNAPVMTARGRLVLGAALFVLFVLSFAGFREYYTHYHLPMLAGILLGFLLFSPTLVAVRYFDRRKREPWALILFVICSVIFFFGPITSHSQAFVGKYFRASCAAGFIEEFWKVAPLLLLLLFVPRAVGGTRDGLIYGALGGFGFAVLQFAAGNVIDNFPAMGWKPLTGESGRATLLGTHNHIIWSATVGASLGWAAVAKPGIKRFIVPLTVYSAVASLHVFNDLGGGFLTRMIAGLLFGPSAAAPPEPESFVEKIFFQFQIYTGTVNLLVVNIVLLPVLYRVLCCSGDAERRIIREQLDSEIGGAITREEFEGVVGDRRYRTRRIEDLPPPVSKRIVRMQNELAFHKAFAASRHEDPDDDQPVRALRQQIAVARFENN